MDGARRADTRPAYDSYGRSTGTLPTWRNWQRTALVMRRLGVRVPPSAPAFHGSWTLAPPGKNPPRSGTSVQDLRDSAEDLDAGRVLAVHRDLAAVVDPDRRALAQVEDVAVGPAEGVGCLHLHGLTVAHDHRVVVHALRGRVVDAEVTEVGDGTVAQQQGVRDRVDVAGTDDLPPVVDEVPGLHRRTEVGDGAVVPPDRVRPVDDPDDVPPVVDVEGEAAEPAAERGQRGHRAVAPHEAAPRSFGGGHGPTGLVAVVERRGEDEVAAQVADVGHDTVPPQDEPRGGLRGVRA